MFGKLKDLKIKYKVMSLVVVISIISVILVCVTFTFYDRNNFHANFKENLSVLAQLVSENSAALIAFDSTDEASDLLQSMSANDSVVAAALYVPTEAGSRNQTIFANYVHENFQGRESVPGLSGGERAVYEGDSLIVVKNVFDSDGEEVGRLYLKAHTDEIRARFLGIIALSALVLLVSAVVALFIAAYTQGMISGPILHLVDIMHGVTENEDFSLRADKDSEDELGQLVDGFNSMVAHTENIIQKIQDAVADLDNTSTDVVQASQNQASGAAEQSAGITQAVAAVEESAKTSAQISENAMEVSELAQSSLDTVQTGQVTVQQVVQAMEMISTSTTESGERISMLEDKAEEITNVLGQIDDIARRTDLIALNAQIEAVNAGDQGRGFMVVAEEVKRLAGQTMDASTQIKALTTEITNEIGDSVTASQQSTDQVTEGVGLAEETGEHLEKIMEMVQRTAEAATLIDSSTKQQQSASEQVVDAMREVDGVSRGNEADAQKSLTTSEELVQIGQTLQGMLKVQGNGDNPNQLS